MKVYWLIIPLLLFVGVSMYADIYRGYRTIDCTGEYLIADSLIDLYKQDGQEGPDGEVWNFESYIELPFIEDCRRFSGTVSIIVKILLANDDTPPVVFLPAPFPFTVPWADFDEEKNQELLDSWLPKAKKRRADWEGIYSGATLSTEVTVEWKLNKDIQDETERNTLAQIDFEKDPWEIEIFLRNIYVIANAHQIPPQHLIIYAQMEELIHAKQAKKLAERDGMSTDEFEGFDLADFHAMEVEAKITIEEEVWPILYGILPPLLLEPLENNPAFEDYWENREEYYELVEKERNGEIEEPDVERFEALKEYFRNLPLVGSRINQKYEGKAEEHQTK
ncbi:MAG: hypothetical protein F4166_10050 [Gammaproteobacteria bacterium]|nr:hypothetical protein [Gammaproteobacteria bacterium]